MIIDNIDREHEPGVMSPGEPPFASVIKLFPRADHGAIVVTTRLVSLKSQFANGLKLSEMNRDDARAILQLNTSPEQEGMLLDHRKMSSITRNTNISEETEMLLNRLSGLPLALAQAKAFIEQTGMSLSAYIKHYDSKWNETNGTTRPVPFARVW